METSNRDWSDPMKVALDQTLRTIDRVVLSRARANDFVDRSLLCLETSQAALKNCPSTTRLVPPTN